MKIVITISDHGAAANLDDAVVENRSVIMEIPEDLIPNIVKGYLKDSVWKNISFSLLDDGSKDPINLLDIVKR